MAVYDFSGKVVLISGAGGGFGRDATRRFAEAGAHLVLTDYGDRTLDTAMKIAREAGSEAVGVAGDIAEEAVSRKWVELAVETHGRIDIAINNAGIAQPQLRVDETPAELARRVIDIDVMGVFYAMHHQIARMRDQFEEDGSGGVILNTASIAGLVGAPKLAIYAAAKHAVVGLTKSAALENAHRNIRINAICPAFTKTDMVMKPLLDSPHGPEEAEQRMIGNIAMRRLGEPAEIVEAMLWACDPANSFYTGQALAVDGGLSAG